MNRKSLARTSSQPGKTQTINYYNINDAVYFVDLPGYGYTNASLAAKAAWGKMVENYLHRSGRLCAVFLLLDIRHTPSDNDRSMYDWIVKSGRKTFIIATKIDKVKKTQIGKQMKQIRDTLKLGDETPVVPFSAKTRQGRDEIYGMIDAIIEQSQSQAT
jgi:GTP-binding protein